MTQPPPGDTSGGRRRGVGHVAPADTASGGPVTGGSGPEGNAAGAAETEGNAAGAAEPEGGEGRRARPQRQAMLLRLDPAVHEALTAWAADELRSVNAQVELLLRRALAQAGRAPKNARPIPRRGRPRANPPPSPPPPPTRGE